MKKKTIKNLKAFAVVKKDNPKLNAMDIFPDKDLIPGKDEMVVKVIITVV